MVLGPLICGMLLEVDSDTLPKINEKITDPHKKRTVTDKAIMLDELYFVIISSLSVLMNLFILVLDKKKEGGILNTKPIPKKIEKLLRKTSTFGLEARWNYIYIYFDLKIDIKYKYILYIKIFKKY